MASIPESVKDSAIIPSLFELLTHQGKVRETYTLSKPGDSKPLLLVVASDRLSIFDFVLPVEVPDKGEILTALTHFWMTTVLKDFPNHLEPSKIHPNTHNFAYDLSEKLPEIPLKRALVVKKVTIPPFEMIFRHHLGGSVFKNYQKTGIVAGVKLEPNLQKWSFMPKPLFTPSTKASVGHDVNITVRSFFDQTGEAGHRTEKMFSKAYEEAYQYALIKAGIRILDTKIEGEGIIADEILTPDSSRFTTDEDWKLAMEEGRDPIFYDKEVARVWGRQIVTPFIDKNGSPIIGINNLDPEVNEHIDFVHNLKVPEEVIDTVQTRLHEIFEKLTNQSLKNYQNQFLLRAQSK
ncbi:phosphoribosylaminoimidazolesuccinocarboxamide synthase [Patescibacteria group bacterium]|nr:phosphoribosylaminoimidazolesuccinocarboxamide synthase [Patescibacteria group bacterium]